MSTNLTSSVVIYKQPREKFQVAMDFSTIIENGDSITGTPSITIEPSGYIGMESIFARDNLAYVKICSGVSPVDYRFQFEVTTVSGSIYVSDGILKVREK